MPTLKHKNWQLLPKINHNIIKKNSQYNEIVLQLLYNRGLKEKNDIEKFLNPNYEKNTHDPFLFKDMQEACDLIIKHIKEENKIVVYGDYDADGVTATVLISEILETLKAVVNVYIPNRTSEGYGLNKKAIDEIKNNRTSLIITVDSGIRNIEEVEYIRRKGMDIIITDHHPIPKNEEKPDCLIINPMVENNYPFKYLSGVGVAFKLAKALISKAKLDKAQKEKLEERILDLVAVGTVADCMSLLDENRELVKKGIEVLNKQKRLGLKELINQAQINSLIDSWNIAWQIAPRVNAAGRMDHANTAYELLITKDKIVAQELSRNLNDKNIERQKITEEITDFCINKIKKELHEDKILILVDPAIADNKIKSWLDGVIGLVAGRLCEEFYKPVLMITKSGNEIKGSGRSIDEFNLAKAIEKTRKYFIKYGGHSKACGFTLNSINDLNEFIKAINEIAKKELQNKKLIPRIIIDVQIKLDEIDDQLVKDIESFAPFGENNFRPRFISTNVQVKDIVNMGINGQHVKFRFNGFWALAFSAAEKWQNLKIGDRIDIAYYLEMNEFNGRREAQLKIIDIKTHNS